MIEQLGHWADSGVSHSEVFSCIGSLLVVELRTQSAQRSECHVLAFMGCFHSASSDHFGNRWLHPCAYRRCMQCSIYSSLLPRGFLRSNETTGWRRRKTSGAVGLKMLYTLCLRSRLLIFFRLCRDARLPEFEARLNEMFFQLFWRVRVRKMRGSD